MPRGDHPVLVVETLVDPEQFNGTVYTAQGWGIENGTHQRLDVSLNDDRCRVRDTDGLWILGMLRRLAVSLYMHWRAH